MLKTGFLSPSVAVVRFVLTLFPEQTSVTFTKYSTKNDIFKSLDFEMHTIMKTSEKYLKMFWCQFTVLNLNMRTIKEKLELKNVIVLIGGGSIDPGVDAVTDRSEFSP